MAIVKMNKFSLLAFESQKDKLLEKLQGFEGVQFIDLQNDVFGDNDDLLKDLNKDSVGSKYSEYEENLTKIRFCLEFLEAYVDKQSGLKTFLEGKKTIPYSELTAKIDSIEWKESYGFLKGKEERINYLSNEKTKLETEIASLEKWKNFDAQFKDLKSINQAEYFIGSIPKQYNDTLIESFNAEIKNGYIEIIDSDNQDSFLLVIVVKEEGAKTSDLLKQYGFSSLSITYEEKPIDIIESYKNDIVAINKEIEEIKISLKDYGSRYEELQFAYEYFNNMLIRQNACNNFLKTDKVVAICGYNTLDSNTQLESLIKETTGNDYYLSFSKVNQEIDDVPIKLKNNSFASAFEGILEMYSLPSYNEVDPTPIFSVFYFIFFGMMLSDAGYGLVMVIASAYALSKAKDPAKRGTFKMFLFAGISTVIWGSIYGGWFGDLLPTYFGVKVPFLINPPDSVIQLMIISCAFGIVHIFIGLGIKAYVYIKNGSPMDAVYDVLTWYVTLIGVLIWLLGIPAGKYMFIIGVVGLILTQGRTSSSIVGKIAGGLYGVYGITAYFGDVVSYLRLLALGLTTGFIANAMNLMINLIAGINPILKFTLVPVLFVLFHIFNLLLNAVGTYVHTARLQYLEFFNKFYEGGGRKFKPYKYSDVYVKINK